MALKGMLSSGLYDESESIQLFTDVYDVEHCHRQFYRTQDAQSGISKTRKRSARSMRLSPVGLCEIGGLPYGTGGPGIFEPPSSSIRAMASSSKRRSAICLEDFEIIATVTPNATAISKQPNIIFEFMVLPHFKVATGPRAQINPSPSWPRCHRAKTVCPRISDRLHGSLGSIPRNRLIGLTPVERDRWVKSRSGATLTGIELLGKPLHRARVGGETTLLD